MTVDQDRMPVFTYVADGNGTCVACAMRYPEGATVVRVGVAYCEGTGWRTYHLDCYRNLP